MRVYMGRPKIIGSQICYTSAHTKVFPNNGNVNGNYRFTLSEMEGVEQVHRPGIVSNSGFFISFLNQINRGGGIHS